MRQSTTNQVQDPNAATFYESIALQYIFLFFSGDPDVCLEQHGHLAVVVHLEQHDQPLVILGIQPGTHLMLICSVDTQK